MRFLRAYIRDRRRWWACWITLCATIGVTYFVYNLPAAAIRYVFLLNAFVFMVFMGYDFFRYIEKRHGVKEVLKAISYRSSDLESALDSIEADYVQMVNALIEDKNALITQKDQMQSEMLDYYSLWVHQIKTPIAALDLMLQTSVDPGRQSMSVELFKIEQYVNMALNYLRLDSESSDFVFKPVDVEVCVKQVVKKYRKIFIEKKLGLNLNIEANATLITDEKWLCFALEQIVSNALKYTMKGEIVISYHKGQLIIEDSGCGIQPEDLPRVFDKGFTGYNGRMNTKATGIGLYLTKRVLEKLSLSVDVQSTVGEGTKVIILTAL